MQIGKKDIENILVNMVLKIKNFKKTQIQKDNFLCLFTFSLEKRVNKLKSTYEK
jgi:hypothetical protein